MNDDHKQTTIQAFGNDPVCRHASWHSTHCGGGSGAGIGGGGGYYTYDSSDSSVDAVPSGSSGIIKIEGNATVTAKGGNGDNTDTYPAHAGAGIGTGGAAGNGATGGYTAPTIAATASVIATGGNGNGSNDGADIGTGGDKDGPGGEPTAYVCEIDSVKFSNLSAAVAIAQNSDTITLLQSINSDDTIEIDGASITLDLNGYDLNVTVSFGIGLSVTNGGVALTGEGEFNVTSADGAGVSAENSTVTVTSATGAAAGVGAMNGAIVTVNGNVSAESENGLSVGVMATNSSSVFVGGDVSAEAESGAIVGVMAMYSSSVFVGGDVSAVSENGSSVGVAAIMDASVFVDGDVSAESENSASVGVMATIAAEVTIEGQITVPSSGDTVYITFDGSTNTAKGDYTQPSDRLFYLQYTDGTNNVYVYDPGAPKFTAQGSVNLQNATALVLQAVPAAPLAEMELLSVQITKPGDPLFHYGFDDTDGVTFNPANGTVTIPASVFSDPAFTSGSYLAEIWFTGYGNEISLRAEFTLIAREGGGGGGSSDSSYIICNIIQVPYTRSGSTIASNVIGQMLRSIVDNAVADADGSKTIKLDYSGVPGGSRLGLNLDASVLMAGEDLTFIIETSFGALIFTTEQMLAWFGDNGFGTYSFTLDASSLRLDVKKSGQSAEWTKLTPMARIGVPYSPKTGDNTANLVVTDQNERVMPTSVYENGMVYADIFALGTYEAVLLAPNAYPDVPVNREDAGDIEYVTMRGLISGAIDGTYSPRTAITRADYLLALGKLTGVDVKGFTQSRYGDVSNTSTAMPYIEWAAENGIVAGVGSGLFAPGSSITREQAAEMMTNYAKILGYTLPTWNNAADYADSNSISYWADDAVAAMQKADVMTGRANNLFDPQSSTTRAEAAIILRRFVENVISSRDAEGWSNSNTDLDVRVYYTQNGNALTGWQTIGGNQYYFYDTGTLAVNTTIDGYPVDENGVRKQSG